MRNRLTEKKTTTVRQDDNRKWKETNGLKQGENGEKV